ncbi:TraR/DksA C4-type zinc finger protein [Bacillus tianshenii]|nr:TraR/DksA C4-type zinc finger protein [Bacillus tianshenii]
MGLSGKQIEELKADLLEMKERLERDVETENKGVAEESTELSSFDNHPADTGSELYRREREQAELETVEGELEQINEALERIEEGTYGKCVETGEDISFERLKAIPYAKRTIEAQERAEQSQVRADESPGRGASSRFEDPDEHVEDSRMRTFENIRDEHQSDHKYED